MALELETEFSWPPAPWRWRGWSNKKLTPAWVYGIQCEQFIKIGVSGNIKKRLNVIQLHNPFPCALVFKRKTPAPYHCERRMHELLAHCAVGREWFRVDLEEIRAASVPALAYARQVISDLQRGRGMSK